MQSGRGERNRPVHLLNVLGCDWRVDGKIRLGKDKQTTQESTFKQPVEGEMARGAVAN